MTAKQFKTLKVGDRVYLKNNWNKGYTSTEVLAIDRMFRKVKVLLRSKFLSYRYFPMTVNHADVTGYVGVCKMDTSSGPFRYY